MFLISFDGELIILPLRISFTMIGMLKYQIFLNSLLFLLVYYNSEQCGPQWGEVDLVCFLEGFGL